MDSEKRHHPSSSSDDYQPQVKQAKYASRPVPDKAQMMQKIQDLSLSSQRSPAEIAAYRRGQQDAREHAARKAAAAAAASPSGSSPQLPVFLDDEDDVPAGQAGRPAPPPPATTLSATKAVTAEPQTPPTEMKEIIPKVFSSSSSSRRRTMDFHHEAGDYRPASPAGSMMSDSQDGSEVILDVSEIEDHVNKPEHKLTVKMMRRILPIMMVVLYKADADIARKRKMKKLWDVRPRDWPDSVPFKDPNNGIKLDSGKHGSKPSQIELVKMFRFLKNKYLREAVRFTDDASVVTEVKDEVKNEPMTPQLVPQGVQPPAGLPHRVVPSSSPLPSASLTMTSMSMTPAQHTVPVYSKKHQLKRSPASPPVVSVPQGFNVNVEYYEVAETTESSPSTDVTSTTTDEQPHHVPRLIHAQIDRIKEQFEELHTQLIQNSLDSPRIELERLANEINTLISHVGLFPSKFSVPFNQLGHKVEAELSRGLISPDYTYDKYFPDTLRHLSVEIQKSIDEVRNSNPTLVLRCEEPSPGDALRAISTRDPMLPQEIITINEGSKEQQGKVEVGAGGQDREGLEEEQQIKEALNQVVRTRQASDVTSGTTDNDSSKKQTFTLYVTDEEFENLKGTMKPPINMQQQQQQQQQQAEIVTLHQERNNVNSSAAEQDISHYMNVFMNSNPDQMEPINDDEIVNAVMGLEESYMEPLTSPQNNENLSFATAALPSPRMPTGSQPMETVTAYYTTTEYEQQQILQEVSNGNSFNLLQQQQQQTAAAAAMPQTHHPGTSGGVQLLPQRSQQYTSAGAGAGQYQQSAVLTQQLYQGGVQGDFQPTALRMEDTNNDHNIPAFVCDANDDMECEVEAFEDAF